ncbi:MAG: hypothetical protein BAA00_19230 [Parageobacillus thermoglucosidasius]|nr:MAG: hypothetical protein BAA00_19230 [Parageobacillus thermoglucosidasius]RDE27242.1 hypothetical protein DV714_11515 [Parageobacillus thermoglucosidasius]RDE32619.1 hypothetical protein DV713_12300 [Parageobacillus thermoglucosidasius]
MFLFLLLKVFKESCFVASAGVLPMERSFPARFEEGEHLRQLPELKTLRRRNRPGEGNLSMVPPCLGG